MKMLEALIRMSVSGAAMILTVAVLRAVFLNRLPKKSFVLMWEIVIARLLIPFEIPFSASVYTLLGNVLRSRQPSRAQQVITSVSDNAAAQISEGLAEVGAAETSTASSAREIPVLLIVWLAGTVLLAVLFAVLYIISYRKHRFSERVDCPLLSEFKTRRKIEVRVLSGISSPLTYGILKPKIILPKTLDQDNSEQLRLILSHEITHIKRFDVLRKLAAIIALCVHWFDPLV